MPARRKCVAFSGNRVAGTRTVFHASSDFSALRQEQHQNTRFGGSTHRQFFVAPRQSVLSAAHPNSGTGGAAVHLRSLHRNFPVFRYSSTAMQTRYSRVLITCPCLSNHVAGKNTNTLYSYIALIDTLLQLLLVCRIEERSARLQARGEGPICMQITKPARTAMLNC